MPSDGSPTEAAVEFPQRTPAQQHMVLRQFLFSVTPGRRVPPIARADTPGPDAVAKDPEQTAAGAPRESRRLQHRVTTAHAQELLAVSRSLRGDTGDRPANRPLEVGTLPARCKELLHYYDRCQTAAERARLMLLRSGEDGVVVAPRIGVTGLVRGVKKRLQASSRTYSTDRADYVSLAAYTAALEEEDRRALALVDVLDDEKRRAAEEAEMRARRLQHAARRGPPVLQSALRASAQSPMFTGEAAGAQRLAGGPIGVSLDEAVDATAAIVVDVQKPQLPPPGAASVVKPSEKGKATVVVDDRRPGTAESAPREQSPANRQRGLSTSPSKPTKAQRRARGELITSGVSSLGAAVLSAEAETIENLRCETYAERFPSPTQSPNTASPIGGSPNQRELPTTSAGRRSPVRDAPAVDAQGRREFSKRTCKFDARRPRSFGEILRERFIGDAGSLIEVADTMEHACEAQGATSSAAALRARLPPTRSITGPSPPPESVEAALARTHTSPSGKARAALACVIADGRRAATPSISKPRATLPSTPHSTASNSRPSSKLSMRRPAALTPDLLVRRLPTPSKSR